MHQFADLILSHAVVYTLAADRPWARELAVRDGRILAVGGAGELERYRGPATTVRDLHGSFVQPGFVDVHNHHALAGRAELFELTLPAGAGLPELLDAVRDYASTLPAGAWVTGSSWSSALIGELHNDSARHQLDLASAGHPVLLSDDSRHNRWVNGLALELAGIDRTTPDPAGGQIVHDPVSGEPSGLLLEAAGLIVEQVASAADPLTPEQHVRASSRAIEILHSYGVTAFQDAGVSVDIMRSLKSLDDAGQLSAWVVSSLLLNDQIFGFQPIGAQLLELAADFRSPHHRTDFVKIFLDGVPPAHTAAFLQPYQPDPQHGAHFCGAMTMSAADLLDQLRTAASAGFSAKIHCTGDASVRAVLDAVAVLRGEGFRDTRFQVAHGQFVAPADIARFGELGVSADISPFIWVPGVIPEAIAEVLPADRAARMQPNRSLLDSGALVAGGSDWPVSESPNAWEGIQGLVTRMDPSGARTGTLWAEQAITVEEAIAVFTSNGARAMGIDDVTGSLRPGLSADLIVLDRNPFEVAVDTLADTRIRETIFAGATVFES
ncbi:MAG: amidohydrolase [Actinomycetota bacterium]|nr:amidohydrolase [Actinomycetota bacterium]MDQ2955767.1 amidohydrolase [Actinomycetota bacterium]